MNSARRKRIAELHSACIHLLRAVRTVDDESGLSAARLSALSVLVYGGARTVGGLAAAEGVRSPTMTGLVNGLEADGLVARAPAPANGDRRRVLVSATAAGIRRMQEAQARRIDRLADLLAPLTPDEAVVLSEAAGIIDRAVRTRSRPATVD
ncbi:MAG TPA: MarR family transcriptional regulator [Acidimicrobiales bacterium]|nr:MarR family transcriptional regulator [Acidimicrobiales bacterium]